MNICQKCGQAAASEQKFCPNCGNELFSTGPGGQFSAGPTGGFGQPAFGQAPNFGAQNAAAPARKSRTGLYVGLGLGALAVFILAVLAIGGAIYWYSQTRIPLKDRLVEQVAGWRRGEIKTNVTEDLKKDSTEHFVATYTPTDSSSNRKNVTFVVVRYPSRERAEQAVQDKVKSMQEGVLSSARVVEAGSKTVNGRNVGLRTVLSSMVLEQVVWNVNEDFMLATSTAGNALEFEKNLPDQ